MHGLPPRLGCLLIKEATSINPLSLFFPSCTGGRRGAGTDDDDGKSSLQRATVELFHGVILRCMSLLESSSYRNSNSKDTVIMIYGICSICQ